MPVAVILCTYIGYVVLHQPIAEIVGVAWAEMHNSTGFEHDGKDPGGFNVFGESSGLVFEFRVSSSRCVSFRHEILYLKAYDVSKIQ